MRENERGENRKNNTTITQLNIAKLYEEASELGLEYGTMTLDEVRRQVDKMKKENLLKNVHTSKINPPTEKNPRWQTYVTDPKTGKRNFKVRGKTKEDLIQKLMDYYYPASTHLDNLTMTDLYNEWLEEKTKRTTSPNTIAKHEEHYKKYLKDTPFFRKKLIEVNLDSLELFSNELIALGMTKNLWTNVKTILKGMLRYAERHYGTTDLARNGIKTDIHFQQPNALPERKVFNQDEQEDLKAYLDKYFSETHDLSFLAIRLNLLMGLRLGELSALRWEDLIKTPVRNKKTGKTEIRYAIHVYKSELTNKKTKEVYIANHTKSYEARKVPLVKDAVELLEKIRSYSTSSEWIFSRDGRRLKNREIEYVLDKYSERNGLPLRSSHCIRRTYASNLYASHVPIKDISLYLGHRNVTTTEKYIFSITTEDEKYDMLEKALSSEEVA